MAKEKIIYSEGPYSFGYSGNTAVAVYIDGSSDGGFYSHTHYFKDLKGQELNDFLVKRCQHWVEVLGEKHELQEAA